MKLDTWKKLNDSDKRLYYSELSSHDKFLVRISEPIRAVPSGKFEMTDEDKETLKELKEYAKKVKENSINIDTE